MNIKTTVKGIAVQYRTGADILDTRVAECTIKARQNLKGRGIPIIWTKGAGRKCQIAILQHSRRWHFDQTGRPVGRQRLGRCLGKADNAEHSG